MPDFEDFTPREQAEVKAERAEEPCLGHLTSGLKDNASDVCDIWNKNPMRRHEFGPREIHDIRETVLGLKVVLAEYDRRNTFQMVVNNG